MLQTPSKRYVIVDCTAPDFFPGRTLPQDWEKQAQIGGVWFFLPEHWLDAGNLFGNPAASKRGFPFCYSEGYESAEEAMLQACLFERREHGYCASQEAYASLAA